MAGKRFKRTQEDFVCEWCGAKVKGTGYTDHCPKCLTSKHVDVNPGDRASECQGKLVPISAIYKGGEFKITYVCKNCLEEKRVGAAAADNRDLLIKLASSPAKGKK